MSGIPAAPWADPTILSDPERWEALWTPSQTFSFYPAIPVPLGLSCTDTPPHPCPYLNERCSRSRGFRCAELPGWAYQGLLDAGFRRSGDVFYQMICSGCRSCLPIRVPVAEFRASRSQRRTWRRNQDLSVQYGQPRLSDEKHALYRRYLRERHDGSMSGEREEMEQFLYSSPTETLEVTYRDRRGTLVGVGICDVTPTALSTVYFYFDPDQERRSLGIFSSLVEVAVARSAGLRHYYLGYWVAGCRAMAYKTVFRPAEVLGGDARWRRLEEIDET